MSRSVWATCLGVVSFFLVSELVILITGLSTLTGYGLGAFAGMLEGVSCWAVLKAQQKSVEGMRTLGRIWLVSFIPILLMVNMLLRSLDIDSLIPNLLSGGVFGFGIAVLLLVERPPPRRRKVKRFSPIGQMLAGLLGRPVPIEIRS